MGDDLFVSNIARVSFAKESKEFKTIEQMPKGSDEGIINYLARENHWSPFGHPQITLRVKAPVPIRTQCFKSKVGFVENEESRRYISTTPELFVPDSFRVKPEGSIKQGSGGQHKDSDYWVAEYRTQCLNAIEMYESMIRSNIAPEQARLVLPQGVMVNWIWTGSLAAYARFCKLRQDSHAQQEVKQVADEVDEILKGLFPYCWKALMRVGE
jgi:thymidylate synthase (FAD)